MKITPSPPKSEKDAAMRPFRRGEKRFLPFQSPDFVNIGRGGFPPAADTSLGSVHVAAEYAFIISIPYPL
jgi:hypothetical protein